LDKRDATCAWRCLKNVETLPMPPHASAQRAATRRRAKGLQESAGSFRNDDKSLQMPTKAYTVENVGFCRLLSPFVGFDGRNFPRALLPFRGDDKEFSEFRDEPNRRRRQVDERRRT
jgi:hypothetical protein